MTRLRSILYCDTLHITFQVFVLQVRFVESAEFPPELHVAPKNVPTERVAVPLAASASEVGKWGRNSAGGGTPLIWGALTLLPQPNASKPESMAFTDPMPRKTQFFGCDPGFAAGAEGGLDFAADVAARVRQIVHVVRRGVGSPALSDEPNMMERRTKAVDRQCPSPSSRPECRASQYNADANQPHGRDGMSNALFGRSSLGDLIRGYPGSLQSEVDGWERNKVLAASESDLVDYLVTKYFLDAPTLLPRDQWQSAADETSIDVSHDPRRGGFLDGRRILVPGHRVSVRVPFEGDADLFEFQPLDLRLQSAACDRV